MSAFLYGVYAFLSYSYLGLFVVLQVYFEKYFLLAHLCAREGLVNKLELVKLSPLPFFVFTALYYSPCIESSVIRGRTSYPLQYFVYRRCVGSIWCWKKMYGLFSHLNTAEFVLVVGSKVGVNCISSLSLLATAFLSSANLLISKFILSPWIWTAIFLSHHAYPNLF